MGTVTTRLRGWRKKFGGGLQALTGKLIGNPGMQLAGRATQLGGVVLTSAAKTVGWTRGKLQSLVGGTLRGVGSATHSTDMKAVGVAKSVQGAAHQTLNQ